MVKCYNTKGVLLHGIDKDGTVVNFLKVEDNVLFRPQRFAEMFVGGGISIQISKHRGGSRN